MCDIHRLLPQSIKSHSFQDIMQQVLNFFLGKNSILAALYPEKNDFLYFVATGDGYHTFTTNEKDHNKAKRKLQKLRRALKKRENK